MCRRELAGLGAVALVVMVCAVPAGAAGVAVADFQDDFQVTQGGAGGWSYLWNGGGALGDPGNYRPLVTDGGVYRTAATGGQPDGGPGSTLEVGSSPPDLGMYNPLPALPPLPTTYLRPGLGTSQPRSGGIERAAVVAYTFSAADFAAAGIPAGQPAQGLISRYYFAVANGSFDGMSARVYQDDLTTPVINFSADTVPPTKFPAGFMYETTLDPREFPIGTYRVGDTVYVAIGPDASDVGDEMRLDFTLSLAPVPEPAGFAALPTLAGGLALRRRRRSRHRPHASETPRAR